MIVRDYAERLAAHRRQRIAGKWLAAGGYLLVAAVYLGGAL